MSRFFASDSESESEISEDEPIVQKQTAIASAYAFSDNEEETKRVVRSAKEKRDEEITNVIKLIRNHKKIKDMVKLLAAFTELTRVYQKARSVYEKEENGQTPKFYLRCLAELEDFINECWEDREGRKNMSKNNSKGLATLRQKVRKYNKDFDAELARYRENPDDDDADERRDENEDEAKSGDDSDSDVPAREPSLPQETAPTAASKFMKGASGDEDSDSDSMDWGSSSDEESSSSDDDDKYAGNLAAKFLKKTAEKGEKESDRKRKEKKERREKTKRDKADAGEDDWEVVKKGASASHDKPKMFIKESDITPVNVQKKLNEILAARGKKSTDRSEQIEMLGELLKISNSHEFGPAFELKIRFGVIAAIFDYNLNIATCMKGDKWKECLEQINLCLDLVTLHKEILSFGEHVSDEAENLVVAPYKVRGCLLQVIERMDEEFVKMLQACDPHSPDYVERLKDETAVCDLIIRLQGYLEEKGSSSELCRIYLKRIEHTYYKFDARVINRKSDSSQETTALEIMEMLCKYIYAKDSTDRIRTQAILCHIYFLALHDRWFEARDLLLMSHLQDSIQHSDIPTQIMYNRALVQLGLCGFRHGNIKEAHNALLDIQSGGRAKELLAQGLLPQRYNNERTTEQEKIEKRRQMPFHKHINLELLECVYLVSAMLLEVPQMAAHETVGRKHMISKSFHYQLRQTERLALVGPPESMREHVVAASKAMRAGNWKLAHQYIVNDKMNAKVWDLFHGADKVREMMCQKIKEESMRTYLFMYSGVYDSLSLAALEELFQLPSHTVHSIVSKMIINDELKASLDEPNRMIVLHRTEPSRIQALALQLCDKIYNLHDYNERLWELKHGTFFARNQLGGQQGGGGMMGGGNKGGQDRQWGKGRRQGNRY